MKTNQTQDQLPTSNFRDSLATVDSQGKRQWIFAQQPKGRFYNIRTIVSTACFILFLVLPFLRISGRPVLLFNIPNATFILFGKVFWPQDFFIFGVTMLTFIVFIILFTAAFGRIFCGWVCPQTLFMEMLFRRLEYLVEGDAAAQKVLARERWSSKWVRKKLTKHLVFFLVSFLIANVFLSYVIGTDALFAIIREPVSMHVGGLMAILAFSGIFYAVYAYFREQICTVICPYGRLQGVLLDRNSMIVAYDYKRGEKRAKFRKDPLPETGDCIDCFQCVKVCPTGIDIRNGTQMECVGCTACIDACNAMMHAVGRMPDLIRYASENGIAEDRPLRFSGRMKLYSVLLVVLTGLLSFLLVSRKNVDGTIVRAPGLLYQERGADSLSNLYTVKMVNKTLADIPVTLRLEDAPGNIVNAAGEQVLVPKEGQGQASFFVVLPNTYVHDRKVPVKVGVYSGKEKIVELKTNFMGPFNKQ
ncbi:cytochrome c oxidase accessory protein CcoG [Flavihumibacter petaseus]|uniref:Putative cbb3-type cytochrome c oxidase accessory protein n=1 Tax=Flavihumibacter petaseus NBRC 106054 TaxID=1220578 RepID=A0A0E9N5U4_9BACT|nr:cytochrome c oxidase accessory protein CcoG [Flavihumibacter petaseus]GAO45173.1 putative cbb3-type cytochrome c oxidase accessory protein [Flavihumibacter petaseus NBRC 106054]